jgi:hypothetical protein
MGDGNTRQAKAILRTGSSPSASVVAKAFTKQGTVKAGASKAAVTAAKKVLSTQRKRKLAGRKVRKGNAVKKAAAAKTAKNIKDIGLNATKQAQNRRLRTGD